MEQKYPQNAKLKNNATVEIRPFKSSDAQLMEEFFFGLPKECTEFLKDDVRDPEVIKRFSASIGTENVWALAALDADGKLVADATIHIAQHGWRRHIGEIRVVVAPSHHKLGLAKKLIHHLVNHASSLKLKKLEAQILSTQVGARRAFEHLGFREEACLVDHAQDNDGRLHDLLILTNTVDDLWHKMSDMISDMEHARDGY